MLITKALRFGIFSAFMAALPWCAAYAQPATPPQNGQITDDFLSAEERGASAQGGRLSVVDAMNYEACVDMRVRAYGSGCARLCGDLVPPIFWIQFDYREPIAIVESVPKPWMSYMAETENFISRHFTEFKSGPFGGDEGVQTIKTGFGQLPQRYFETHVWGVSIPTRIIALTYEFGRDPGGERFVAMSESLTYEIGVIVTEALGISEIANLEEFLARFRDMALNAVAPGSATAIKIAKVIKTVTDLVQTIHGVVQAIKGQFQELINNATAPLQDAVKKVTTFIKKMVDAITRPITSAMESLGDAVGKAFEVLQLERGFKVVVNFAGGIANQIKNFTSSWTLHAGEQATEVAAASQTVSDAQWLCSSAHTMTLSTQGGGVLAPPTPTPGQPPEAIDINSQQSGQAVLGAANVINRRIADLGGRCGPDGQPIGRWGQPGVPEPARDAMRGFDQAMTALNKAQDILRTGTITNLLTAAAGSMLPIGLIPSYISEFDRPSWSMGTPGIISMVNAIVGSTPGFCALGEVSRLMNFTSLSETQKKHFCVGVWGPLYPKVGSLIMDEPHTAAAITNYRGFTLAHTLGTLPVSYDPQKAGPVKFNVDHPFRGNKCHNIGTIDPRWNSRLANQGASAALDALTGGVISSAQNISATLEAVAANPVSDAASTAKTDGYVHTYWKNARACMSVCPTGIKWRKRF